MPKVVDAGQRREDIADAALRVIARDGIDHATLQRIAAEARLAIGSVRHYLPSQNDVIRAAMRRLVDRHTNRVLAATEPASDPTRPSDPPPSGPWPPGTRYAVLAALLPLDEPRRQEAAAWMAFNAASQTRPDLRPFVVELHEQTRALIRHVLLTAQDRGHFPAGDELLAIETERLAAVIDGLTMAALTYPDHVDPSLVTTVLTHHLDQLTGAHPPR